MPIQILISQLRTLKTLQREESLAADALLGPSPEFVHFNHPVKVSIKADLIYSEVLVSGKSSSVVGFECVRCLTPFERLIEGDFKQTFGLDEEIIDCTPFLSEAIIINLPMNALCRPDCKGICANCGANKNTSECGCPAPDASVKWEALKNIKFKTR